MTHSVVQWKNNRVINNSTMEKIMSVTDLQRDCQLWLPAAAVLYFASKWILLRH